MSYDLLNDPYDCLAAVTLVLGGLMAFNVKPVFIRFFVPAILSGFGTYAYVTPAMAYVHPGLAEPVIRIAVSVTLSVLMAILFLRYVSYALKSAVAGAVAMFFPSKVAKGLNAAMAWVGVWLVEKMVGRSFIENWIINPLLSGIFCAGAVEYLYHDLMDSTAPRCLLITWKIWQWSCSFAGNRLFWLVLVGTSAVAVITRLMALDMVCQLIAATGSAGTGAGAVPAPAPAAASKETKSPAARATTSPARGRANSPVKRKKA